MWIRRIVLQGLHQQIAAYMEVDLAQTDTINKLHEQITQLKDENTTLRLRLEIVSAEADVNRGKYEAALKSLRDTRLRNAMLALEAKKHEQKD